MATDLIDFAGGKVNKHGQLIFVPDDPTAKQIFIDAFYEDAGEDVTKHFPSIEALNAVFKQLHRLNPSGEITLPDFMTAARLLVLARDPAIFPPEPETEAEPERPRHPNGQFKNEREIFCETHSMDQIRERARTDRAFGTWYRALYKTQTIAEGEYRVIGGTQPAVPDQSTDLRTFVDCLNRMPASERKLVGGFYHINGRRYTKAQFDNEVQLAISAGLL